MIVLKPPVPWFISINQRLLGNPHLVLQEQVAQLQRGSAWLHLDILSTDPHLPSPPLSTHMRPTAQQKNLWCHVLRRDRERRDGGRPWSRRAGRGGLNKLGAQLNKQGWNPSRIVTRRPGHLQLLAGGKAPPPLHPIANCENKPARSHLMTDYAFCFWITHSVWNRRFVFILVLPPKIWEKTREAMHPWIFHWTTMTFWRCSFFYLSPAQLLLLNLTGLEGIRTPPVRPSEVTLKASGFLCISEPRHWKQITGFNLYNVQVTLTK